MAHLVRLSATAAVAAVDLDRRRRLVAAVRARIVIGILATVIAARTVATLAVAVVRLLLLLLLLGLVTVGVCGPGLVRTVVRFGHGG